MNATTETVDPAVPRRSPQVQADMDAVLQSLKTGIPVDPEVRARMRALGAAIREEIFQKHGLLDIGVPIIRELRGELPE